LPSDVLGSWVYLASALSFAQLLLSSFSYFFLSQKSKQKDKPQKRRPFAAVYLLGGSATVLPG